MKKIKSLICALSAVTMAATSVCASVPAFAADEMVYGTMEIPYADFFAAEGINAEGTSYEVDAASSATTGKWAMNTDGSLAEGTFNQANESGVGGQILGVKYPVAISQSDLDALGDDNYNFTALEDAPVSYKTVTVTDGKASFSAVVDDEEDTSDVTATLKTSTVYGDFELDFSAAPYSDDDIFYGAIVYTDDGSAYAMSILENMWRDTELAWSVGYVGSENSKIHSANVLKYNETATLQGKTITSVKFISSSGYTTVNTDVYVPKKTGLDADVISVENAAVADGKTAVTVTLPEDYSATYTASSENLSVADGEVTFADGTLPGKYTLTVSDANNVYVSYSASFTLTSDGVVAAYDADNKKIVAAEGATDADATNFISGISSVSVNGKSYSASGKGSISIINKDGSINVDAVSNNEYIFGEGGTYTIEVTSTGYNNTLKFDAELAANLVYGTMNISYSDFFSSEGINVAGTSYKVDAASSATTSKWAMNTDTGLSQGTYGEANEDGSGKILGVTYPVAITQAALDSLGDSVTFNALETKPASYKYATVTNMRGNISISYSAVKGSEAATSDATATLQTSTTYGDYQLEFSAKPYSDTDVFYGAIVYTDDGSAYAMSVLENWWTPKSELAWSIGYIGSENSKIHNANVLKYSETATLTDKTITSVKFITSSGYTTVNDINIYLPKKTGLDADVISVADTAIKDGKAPVTVTLPEDYSATYTASSETLSVEDGNVVFAEGTLPGKYTLTVSDENGKNVSYSTSFILSTDETVVAYSDDDAKLIAAKNVTEDELANYISNITAVKLGDTTYSTSGRGAVKLINADGTINTSVTSKDREGNETTTDYITATTQVTISANGYEDYTFTYEVEPEGLLGDVNGDTKVDSKDAVKILQFYAATLAKQNPTIDTALADVNSDGSVDSKDAVKVLQYYAATLAKTTSGTLADFLATK